MLSIVTSTTSNASGRPQVIAKANGKQRTVNTDLSKSTEVNHAAAAGTLLNVLTDDRQQAKVRHPSGGMRVQRHDLSDAGGKMRWCIDV